jgi:hypothetical protein
MLPAASRADFPMPPRSPRPRRRATALADAVDQVIGHPESTLRTDQEKQVISQP